ncbi:MAG: hypothetical protein EAZ26_06445, partial [Runella slithyformis]
MERKKYLLISDGSSDKCLLPIIDFVLNAHFPNLVFEGQWADYKFLRKPPQSLSEKISSGIDLYEPDWVFVHRDAEAVANPLKKRSEEIQMAVEAAKYASKNIFIEIIPIKMMETWLLIDEMAIRKAANNPNGKVKIQLPAIRQLENLSQPKELLFDLLKQASGLPQGRKLNNLNVFKIRHFVAEYI